MYSVVIIDDNKIAVEAICRSTDWKTYNCKVVGTAFDGIEGLKLIHEVSPDIVIIDIQMPGFNGLDIVKKIKNQKENIQFIIISGYSQFEYTQLAIRYGVRDYLLKPILTEEMELALEHVIAYIKRGEIQAEQKEMDSLQAKIYAVKAKKTVYSPMVSKALEYVENHIYQTITLTDLCSELMVSNSYFSKCFKRETGVGFINYVSMIKMENARILLKNPRNRVNEVAEMLGYREYAYFFQVFKKQFGYAPSDIKQSGKKGD